MAQVPESKQPGGSERSPWAAVLAALVGIGLVVLLIIWLVGEEEELLVTAGGNTQIPELQEGTTVQVTGTVEHIARFEEDDPEFANFEESNRIVASQIRPLGDEVDDTETEGLTLDDIAGEEVATFAGEEVAVVGEVADPNVGDDSITIVEAD